MILGIPTSTFTLLHVIISLIGIGSGMMVVAGFLRRKEVRGMTAIFLVSTILTSVTGFAFPFDHLTPGNKVGIISMVVLAIAVAALYAFQLRGAWRPTFVITSCIALYLNVFVLIVQLFEKVPALKALAPTQSEPPFLAAQLLTLVLFIGLTIVSSRRFRRAPAAAVLRMAA